MGRAVRDGGGIGDQIEFLAPRDSVFGGDGPADFSGIDDGDLPDPDDVESRAAWLTGAAALAVVALVSIGIVAAAPWDSNDSNVAPPTTTIVPPKVVQPPIGTPIDSPTTGATAAPVTGYVFDPLPPGMAITDASSLTISPIQQVPGWGEVWATSDATRTSGSWFSVTLLNDRVSTAIDATRVALPGAVGLLEQLNDGTLRLSAPVGQTRGNQTLTVTSYGRSPEDLVTLFNSLSIDADRPPRVDDRPVFNDPQQVEGFELVASGATTVDLLDAYLAGSANSSTSYATGSGDTFISIETAPRDESLESLGRLAVGPVRIFPDTASVPSTFTGDDLVLGVSPSGSDPAIVARWHVDATTVVVRTTVPLGDLLELLPTLRRTTDAEWKVVERRAARAQPTSDSNPSASDGTPIGGGTLEDGTTWTVALHRPSMIEVATEHGTYLQDLSSRDEPISVWSSQFAAIVTAITTGDPSSATFLRVLARHQVLTDMQMVDIGAIDPTSSFTGGVGVFVFQQTGPFQVDIVDAQGSVLAHFSSPGSPP